MLSPIGPKYQALQIELIRPGMQIVWLRFIIWDMVVCLLSTIRIQTEELAFRWCNDTCADYSSWIQWITFAPPITHIYRSSVHHVFGMTTHRDWHEPDKRVRCPFVAQSHYHLSGIGTRERAVGKGSISIVANIAYVGSRSGSTDSVCKCSESSTIMPGEIMRMKCLWFCTPVVFSDLVNYHTCHTMNKCAASDS